MCHAYLQTVGVVFADAAETARLPGLSADDPVRPSLFHVRHYLLHTAG